MPAFSALPALLAGLILLLGLSPALAQSPYGGRAPNYFVLDLSSGQILAEQNADVALPPASMSKLMTLAMLFDALRDGRVAMDTQWSVSPRAHAMGGSRMFLELRDRPTTEDLIRGIAVVSGNDASVVVAEGLAGSEDNFAAVAQARARQLGMEQTTIANASGWPDPRHRMSLRDLGILSRYLVEEHSQLYHYLGETGFTWNGITQPNRVPLLAAGIGVDGLKTGHTEEAGYALAGSAIQGDRRIVFVFSGLAEINHRVEETERIVTWAFRQFASRTVLREGEAIAQAEVWLGTAPAVDLVAPRDLTVLVPAIQQGDIAARVEYDGPLSAPVAAGAEVARLIVDVPGLPQPFTLPLIAGSAVPAGGVMTRVQAALSVLGGHLGLGTP
jgi:D-alanyl-D-alanine carboxypeptidase (penicillin-binding protein 5/6)